MGQGQGNKGQWNQSFKKLTMKTTRLDNRLTTRRSTTDMGNRNTDEHVGGKGKQRMGKRRNRTYGNWAHGT